MNVDAIYAANKYVSIYSLYLTPKNNKKDRVSV